MTSIVGPLDRAVVGVAGLVRADALRWARRRLLGWAGRCGLGPERPRTWARLHALCARSGVPVLRCAWTWVRPYSGAPVRPYVRGQA